MSKNGMQRAIDLGQTAKAIRDIIKAGLKGGWQGAAFAALKAYWPKLLSIAIVVVLLPAIIVCCLPAILLGWGGSNEQLQVETYQDCYDRYELYRTEQLNEVKDQHIGDFCGIEYVNEPFDKNWLIAIDSVNNDNDISDITEEKLKDLIKKTYTYEIVYTVLEEYSLSDPWEDAIYETEDSTDSRDEPDNTTKTIKVTTVSPEEVMRSMDFDEEKTNWAMLIYSTLSGT